MVTLLHMLIKFYLKCTDETNTFSLCMPVWSFLDSSCSHRALTVAHCSMVSPVRSIIPQKYSVEEIKALFSASQWILKTGLFVSRAMFNGFPPSSKCLRKHRPVSAQCQNNAGTTGINLTGGERERQSRSAGSKENVCFWEIAGMSSGAYKQSDSS